MSIIRRAIAFLTIALAVLALYFGCWLPYQCNRVKRALIAPTRAAYEARGFPRAQMIARTNLEAIERCAGLACRDVSSGMIKAANLRVLGRNREAANLYRELLSLQKRPEIYMNLGQTEVDMGNRGEAVRSFFMAARFNPWLIRDIEDGMARQAVFERIASRFPMHKDLLEYIAALSSTPE